MIIKCQEHYDKVVEYAKSIGDNTLQQCIEPLSWQTGRIIRRDAQSVPWMEHTHLKIKSCKAHFPR